WWELRVVPVVLVVVLTVVAVPVTWMIAVALAMLRTRFTRTVAPTVRVSGWLAAGPKPVAVAETTYRPKGSPGATKFPPPLLCSAVWIPVPVFVTVTAALGTTAPEESATEPEIVPVSNCAKIGCCNPKQTAVRIARWKAIRLIRAAEKILLCRYWLPCAAFIACPPKISKKFNLRLLYLQMCMVSHLFRDSQSFFLLFLAITNTHDVLFR